MSEPSFVPCDARTSLFYYYWSDDGAPLHTFGTAAEILAARDDLLRARKGRVPRGEHLVVPGIGPVVGVRTYLRGEAIVEELSLRALLEHIAQAQVDALAVQAHEP